jgi:hypothetical protein
VFHIEDDGIGFAERLQFINTQSNKLRMGNGNYNGVVAVNCGVGNQQFGFLLVYLGVIDIDFGVIGLQRGDNIPYPRVPGIGTVFLKRQAKN